MKQNHSEEPEGRKGTSCGGRVMYFKLLLLDFVKAGEGVSCLCTGLRCPT